MQHPLSRLARNSAERPWYSVRNLADGEAELFIYDFIGYDPFFGGVGAADFVRELRGLNARKLSLRINSPGGDISEAVTIRNALIEHPAEKETHVDGLAASSASWVGMGDWPLIMSPHAMLMIHEPWNIVAGDADYMRKQAEILDKYAVDIASMLQEKGGGTVDQWREKMRAETWYSDQEAVSAGLADEIATKESSPENRYDRAILGIYRNTPAHLTAGRDALDRNDHRHADSNEPDTEANDGLVRQAFRYQLNRASRQGVLV